MATTTKIGSDFERARRLDVDIPMPLYERLEKALGDVIQKGLLPASTGVRDFLLSTIVINGLAMIEADLKNRDRQTRLVLSPDEAAQAAQQLKQMQKIGARHVG